MPRGGRRRAVRPSRAPRGCCAHARPDAEKIDVGVAAPQPLEQEAICYLLAEKAREGKIVARLKWGDPFVFDRGGTEALFLHEQGVRFEVVPGIPAGIARAELRRRADHLSRRRRHADVRSRPRRRRQDARRRSTGRASRASTARSSATPGREQLPRDARRAALARPAGRRLGGARLRRHAADAGDDRRHARRDRAADASESTDRRPAILVVGRVAALREHLRWFDARPLFGKRILVTRPREQAGELVELLEALGAEAIEAPMIRIVPPDDYGAARRGVRARRRRSTGSSSRAPTPSTRSSSGCSPAPRRSARAEGREAVRGRPGDRRAARALRPEGRPDARPSTAPKRVVQALPSAGDVQRPAGSCCRAPTSAAR